MRHLLLPLQGRLTLDTGTNDPRARSGCYLGPRRGRGPRSDPCASAGPMPGHQINNGENDDEEQKWVDNEPENYRQRCDDQSHEYVCEHQIPP